jgi:hypothetical protein
MRKIALIGLLALVGCGADEEPEGLASESEARVIVSCAVALAGDNYTEENVDAVMLDCSHGGDRHVSIKLSDYSTSGTNPTIPFWVNFEFANRSEKPVPFTLIHDGSPCKRGGNSAILYKRYGYGFGSTGCPVSYGKNMYRISLYYGSEERYKELKRLDSLGEPLASIEFNFTVKQSQ